jgi:hypothetical protein
VILLLAFALILNVHASSAATTNETSSLNTGVNTVSANLASTSTVSVNSSNQSKNSNIQIYSSSKAVSTTTDKTKPKVVKSDPVKNALKVNPKQNIKITFNEAIKIGNKWIEFRSSNGKLIPIKTAILGKILIINPVNDLKYGSIYMVIIHSGTITDLSGNKNTHYGIKFTTAAANKPVSAALAKYLIPTTNCQSTNPKIKALAASITKGSTSQYTKASKIFNWVRDHISYSFYYNTRKGALGTLSSRSANCADTAHLVVALERAAGIPARYNHGTCKFSSGNWYGHVWAQVYVNNKWYYADGTSSRNSFGVVKNWNTNSFTLHGIYATLPF